MLLNFKKLLLCILIAMIYVQVYKNFRALLAKAFQLLWFLNSFLKTPVITNSGPSTMEYLEIYDLSAPLHDSYNCIATKLWPNPVVCLHDVERDEYVSRRFVENGAYDSIGVLLMQSILSSDPELGFIDAGANIGAYSLTIAKMKRKYKVVAVEPLLENVKRLQKGAQLSGVTKNILLVNNAISNVRTTATFQCLKNNQAGTRVRDSIHSQPISSCGGTVNTILLNDLLEVIPFKKAVIKIDIEGFEHKAFDKGEELLNQINITHIYMEWHILRYIRRSDIQEYILLTYLMKMLTRRKFMPFSILERTLQNNTQTGNGSIVWDIPRNGTFKPSSVVVEELDMNHWRSWPQNVLWAKAKPCLRSVLRI